MTVNRRSRRARRCSALRALPAGDRSRGRSRRGRAWPGPRWCLGSRGRSQRRHRCRDRRRPARGHPGSTACRSRRDRGGARWPGHHRGRTGPRPAAVAAPVTECAVDRPRPFIGLARLPDEQHQSGAGSQGGGDVRERGDRISEEHRSKPADRHVESTGCEPMRLGIVQLVMDVAEPLGRRRLTAALDHALRDVDPHNAPRRCRPRCLASGQPSAAANIEHLVTRTDPAGETKVLVVGPQFGVVEVHRGHGGDAIDDGSTTAARFSVAIRVPPPRRPGRSSALHFRLRRGRSCSRADG